MERERVKSILKLFEGFSDKRSRYLELKRQLEEGSMKTRISEAKKYKDQLLQQIKKLNDDFIGKREENQKKGKIKESRIMLHEYLSLFRNDILELTSSIASPLTKKLLNQIQGLLISFEKHLEQVRSTWRNFDIDEDGRQLLNQFKQQYNRDPQHLQRLVFGRLDFQKSHPISFFESISALNGQNASLSFDETDFPKVCKLRICLADSLFAMSKTVSSMVFWLDYKLRFLEQIVWIPRPIVQLEEEIIKEDCRNQSHDALISYDQSVLYRLYERCEAELIPMIDKHLDHTINEFNDLYEEYCQLDRIDEVLRG